jgi:exopolysaccharide biosynthesis polyprenyl glycosylphosphotransferase
MLRKSSRFQAQLAAACDAVLVALAMFGARFAHKIVNFYDPQGLFSDFDLLWARFWLVLLPIPIWMFFLDFFGLYDHLFDPAPRRHRLASVVQAAFLSLTVTLTVLYVFRAYFPRSLLVLHAAVAATLVYLRARVLQPLLLRAVAPPRTILVGDASHAAPLATALAANPRLQCVGLVSPTPPWDSSPLPALGPLSAFPDILHSHVVDAAIVLPAALPPADIESVLSQCSVEGVEIWLFPAQIPHAPAPPVLDDFDGRPMLVFSQNDHSAWGLAVKRLADIVISAILLVLLSPLFLLFALLIKRSSPGPVFFSQIRSTRHGRTFPMYKFRTMVANAEALRETLADQNEVSGPVFKIKNDPRVTPVGRFLRRYSLDELPQLWNVLRGDMSLVGPRPPIPAEVAQYEPWQRRRLSMRSGCTCLWQVGGRNALEFEDWMRLDLQYIDNWSLFLDFKILLKTFSAMLRGTGF